MRSTRLQAFWRGGWKVSRRSVISVLLSLALCAASGEPAAAGPNSPPQTAAPSPCAPAVKSPPALKPHPSSPISATFLASPKRPSVAPTTTLARTAPTLAPARARPTAECSRPPGCKPADRRARTPLPLPRLPCPEKLITPILRLAQPEESVVGRGAAEPPKPEQTTKHQHPLQRGAGIESNSITPPERKASLSRR